MSTPLIALSCNIKEHGNRYYKTLWYLAKVPLNKIEFINAKPERYIKNKELIQTTGATLPVIISDDINEDGKYTLIDGNHRCFCSNELGYTHIPAIIPICINTFEKIPLKKYNNLNSVKMDV